MPGTEISARRIGLERQPIVIVDGFHPDPDALRSAAIATTFEPALRNYPGIRAELPPDYFEQVRPALALVLREVFEAAGGMALIDASFSIVTASPQALTLEQRIPHVDSVKPNRFALVHFLSDDGDGTAFFRHRTTGYETVDEARSDRYLKVLNAELRTGPALPPAYIGDIDLRFEQIAKVEARFNRAVIYRSMILHSGAISAGAKLDADPASGRLTVTVFLSSG